MRLQPLKKVILAASLLLPAAFNVAAQAVPAAAGQALSTSADSIHKDYNDKGAVIRIERYRHGLLNDGPNGEPALQRFFDNGKPYFTHRYRDGVLNDGADGAPAYQLFSENGLPAIAEHYKDGLLNDGADGAPAKQQFDGAGRLIEAARYKDGVFVAALSAAEIAACQKQKEAALRKKSVGNQRKINNSFPCY